MLHMTPAEREKMKSVLRIVYEDTSALRKEFQRVSRAKENHPGDHQSSVLGVYASVLKEILDDRDPELSPSTFFIPRR